MVRENYIGGNGLSVFVLIPTREYVHICAHIIIQNCHTIFIKGLLEHKTTTTTETSHGNTHKQSTHKIIYIHMYSHSTKKKQIHTSWDDEAKKNSIIWKCLCDRAFKLGTRHSTQKHEHAYKYAAAWMNASLWCGILTLDIHTNMQNVGSTMYIETGKVGSPGKLASETNKSNTHS